MKHISLSFSVIILCFSLTLGQPSDGIIYWDQDRLLKWDDFEGKPVKNTPYHAQTHGSLNYTFDSDGPGVYTFRLNVKFDKNKSWSKPKEQTDNLLNHEQGHFNIYEIYGRMIMKQITESKVLNDPEFSEKIEKLFRKSFSDLQKFQREYDDETNHSKDPEKQEEWNKNLKNKLNSLADYKVKDIQFKVAK